MTAIDPVHDKEDPLLLGIQWEYPMAIGKLYSGAKVSSWD